MSLAGTPGEVHCLYPYIKDCRCPPLKSNPLQHMWIEHKQAKCGSQDLLLHMQVARGSAFLMQGSQSTWLTLLRRKLSSVVLSVPDMCPHLPQQRRTQGVNTVENSEEKLI